MQENDFWSLFQIKIENKDFLLILTESGVHRSRNIATVTGLPHQNQLCCEINVFLNQEFTDEYPLKR